jgi:shikimate kinase
MNILLIGPRASGKSSIGPELARALVRPFVELDELALKSTGLASVRLVWKQLGEPAWRSAEAAAFAATITRDEQIVALGGGAPMIPAVNQAIQAERAAGRAFVVYLRCEVSALQTRLAATPGDRPSLTGVDPIEEIEAVVRSRETTYQALADLACETTNAMPEDAARQIAHRIDELLGPTTR